MPLWKARWPVCGSRGWTQKILRITFFIVFNLVEMKLVGQVGSVGCEAVVARLNLSYSFLTRGGGVGADLV
jgi:hypothetical protein